jgi:hypothetical protein
MIAVLALIDARFDIPKKKKTVGYVDGEEKKGGSSICEYL